MPQRFPYLLCGVLCCLVAAVLLSLRIGAAPVELEALRADARGILSSRTLRTLCAVAVGAALAVSGLLLQTLTRNPLADPGITGINAGAALAAVSLAFFAPDATGAAALAAAALGAGLAGGGLWLLAGGFSATDDTGIALRLPLAGLAIEALCLSLASALILMDAEMQARYLRWISGAVPAVARGEGAALCAIALCLATGGLLLPRLGLLSLGAQTSHSLGRNPAWTAALVLLHVTVLSGASVAIAGPFAFVGLLVPFVARALAQGDLCRAYVLAVPLGAAGLLFADVAGRVIARPGEVDAGILVSLIGGPSLIIVLRHVLLRGAQA